MAEKCPDCGRELSLLDWRQNCPDCGTNLMFNGFEERFFDDAKLSELGLAKVRVWWTGVLACYFGGKLQIMRFVFILLPVAALLLPFCTLSIKLPLYTSDISLSLIGAVSAVTDSTLTTAFSLSQAPVTGVVIDALSRVFIALFGTVACAVLIILMQLLSPLGARLMSGLLCAVSASGVLLCVYGMFTSNALSGAADGFSTVFSVTGGFGCYVLAAAFIAVFVPNLLIAKKGIEVNYKQGDLYRVEVAKKLRRGEVRLSDLPQPIFETEEERIAREKAIEDTVNGVSSEADEREAAAK